LNAAIIPAAASLIDEIARRLMDDGRDIRDALVVFPGKRPAHFLRRRLAEEQGSSFVPPRILSMDELVDLVFETRETRAGRIRPKLEPIDAVALLHDIQLGAARPVGGKAFMTLDSFFPIGLKIHHDLEELLIEKVSSRKTAEVQTLVEQEVPPRSRERLQSLAYFYDAFYPAVEAKGLSTRSSRYRLVSDEIEPDDLPTRGPIILAGFYALTESEAALLRKLKGWPSVQLVFQEGPGLRRKIRGLALQSALETDGPSTPRPEVHFYSSPDSHGQVFALSAALSSPDSRTLILLPRPDKIGRAHV
jgi:ATP-dependent helicase/nuclease subunit B